MSLWARELSVHLHETCFMDSKHCISPTVMDHSYTHIGVKRKREDTNCCPNCTRNLTAVCKKTSVVNLLSRRESGLRYSTNFVPDMSAMKVRQLKLVYTFDTAHPGIQISECEFIRGARNGKSLIGLWRGEHYDAIIYRLTFDFNKVTKVGDSDIIPPIVRNVDRVGPFFALTRVRDMCDARFRQQNCVLYVGNRFNERSIMEGSTVLCNFTNDSYTYGRQYISKRDILSCAGNAHGELFATGTEQGCYIFDDDRFTYKARLPGNVRSIEFNNSGKMLFCGVDTAGLTVFDLREPPWNRRTVRVNRFGPIGVSETKLLSDEKSMIVSGIDGTLSKIDLNKNETVLTYPGYAGSSRKVPFSLNETADLLCATGADNITKLWSLSTGKPLHSIKPRFNDKRSHSWLMTHGSRWFVSILQKDKLFILEPRDC